MNLKYFLFIFFVSLSNLGFTQDIITKIDGSVIEAIVSEVSETGVKYHRFDNPSGPLYSLNIQSVKSIKYKNGSVDNFNEEILYDNLSEVSSFDNVSKLTDDQLIQLANKNNFEPIDKLYFKARKLKKIGIIGGISIAAIGVVINGAVAISNSYPGSWSSQFPVGTLCSVAGGAVWFASFYLAANQQIKRAKAQMAYNVPIFETKLIKWNTCLLTANVNVVKELSTSNSGLGLGLTLKF